MESQKVPGGRTTALFSAYRCLKDKVATEISVSTHTPADGSSNLKLAFHTKIWPSLRADYEMFVYEIVRYCRDELLRREFGCQVMGRAKTIESVEKSLNRRENNRHVPYAGLNDIFETMHDLAGCMIIMRDRKNVEEVNKFITQNFRAITPPNHWRPDHEASQSWKPRFVSYESYNHHVTLIDDIDRSAIVFEIQVTTCGDFMYNRLAHPWYYKKAHGTISKKDQMVMDMVHGATILFEIGSEYMSIREDENRQILESGYSLSEVLHLAEGVNSWQVIKPGSTGRFEALSLLDYHTPETFESTAKIFRDLETDGTSGNHPMTRILEFLSQVPAQLKEHETPKSPDETLLERADVAIHESYNPGKLIIERISREPLPIEQCYINLALVRQPEQDKHHLSAASLSLSLSDRLKIETPEETLKVDLRSLFNPRKVQGGQTKEPRRILIRGRAGVGKTTLCKKIVYEFAHAGMWDTLFDRVLWIPLRKLKLLDSSEYHGWCLLRQLYLWNDPDTDFLAKDIWRAINKNSDRTLFLLDGLDEASEFLDPNHKAFKLLAELFHKTNVIITTRPYVRIPNEYERPSLELDTIGFYPEQVQEYLKQVVKDPSKVKSIQLYFQKHWLIQSLVRIPIQLDAFCVVWDTGFENNRRLDTMSGVYNAIVQHLWGKDTMRLSSNAEFSRNASPSEITDEIEVEEEFLERLSFSGIYSDMVEFQAAHRDIVYNILKSRLKGRKGDSSLYEWLGRLSFLRTSDSSTHESARGYHFLHLTFQEFFAARYFIRYWRCGENIEYHDLNTGKPFSIHPIKFLQQEKYAPQYDILWRFTAGLLRPYEVPRFFEQIEQEPRDLLGPSHQRLLMCCLNEADSSNFPNRINLEKELSRWIRLESKITGQSKLAGLSECPDRVLISALENGSMEEKKGILRGLRHPDKRFSGKLLAAFITLFEDDNIDLRCSAIEVVGCQSDLPESIIAIFISFLKDENPNIRNSAIFALGDRPNLPELVMAIFISFLKDENVNIRNSVIYVLKNRPNLPESAMAILISFLKDENPNIQNSAIRALGNRPDLPESAMATLISFLKDENVNIRNSAIFALGNRSDLPESAITTLISFLKDENLNIWNSVIFALGNQPDLPESAIATLISFLKDENPNIQNSAISALGNRPDLPESAITTLISFLEDENPNVRNSAIHALGDQLDLPESVITILISFLKNKNPNIRNSAIRALGNRPDLPKSAMAILISFLKDENVNIRNSAIFALGNRSNLPESAITTLISFLKDKNPNIRNSAIHALGNQPDLPESAITTLISFFKDENVNIRNSAIFALGNRPDLPQSIVKDLFENANRNYLPVITLIIKNPSHLSDRIFEALGFSPAVGNQSSTAKPLLYKPQLIESVYKSLLWRSFHQQCSFYFSESRTLCHFQDSSGQRVTLIDRRAHNLLLKIVKKGRQSLDVLGSDFERSLDEYSPRERQSKRGWTNLFTFRRKT